MLIIDYTKSINLHTQYKAFVHNNNILLYITTSVLLYFFFKIALNDFNNNCDLFTSILCMIFLNIPIFDISVR